MNKLIVHVTLLTSLLFAGAAPGLAQAPSPEPAGCPSLSLAPLALPSGQEEDNYLQVIRTYGGKQPVKLEVVSGSLPPGIIMSAAGELQGIPRASGVFDFTVQATDSCPTNRQRVSRSMRLVTTGRGKSPAQPSVIRHQKLSLKIISSPAMITLAAKGNAEQEVSYLIEAAPAHTATLKSSGGSFSVAGSVLEMVSVPMTVTLINGKGTVSEKITIPAKVLKAARQEKAKISYSRPFSGRQTTGLAIVEFSLEK